MDLLDPLVHIFNSSFEEGVFPTQMKVAKVLPLFKAGNSSDVNNYRPISILPAFSKIFEKLVAKRLRKFLESKNILSDTQFGFRPGYSTELALTSLKNSVCKSIDEGLYTCGICLDLSKAFDTVNHNILLSKLEKYGIRSKPLCWFKSYLSNRKQFVELNSCKSRFETIKYGVPQGSVLGPLLFLLYINDLSKSSSLLNFLSFADDTTIHYSNNSLINLFSTLNFELKKVSTWLKLNKLTLNTDKTKYLIFSSVQKLYRIKGKYTKDIVLNDTPIERVDKIKLLGVIISEDFKWEAYITSLCNKLSRNVAIINKLKNYISSSILLKLYNTLITPHINYCITVWGNSESYNLDRVLRLRKKAVSSICRVSFLDHSNPLFKQFNILKVDELFKLNIGKFMYKLSKNNLPKIFVDDFPAVSEIHNYRTRSAKLNRVHVSAHNTALFSKTIIITGPKIWNKIPFKIKESKTIKSFKKSFVKHIIESQLE